MYLLYISLVLQKEIDNREHMDILDWSSRGYDS
jgi:hypothetical protein